MVFRITEEDKAGHRLIAGTHCSSSPIVDIHPTLIETDFPSPATPTPAVNILIICGDTSMSSGSALLYELISSPYQSPLTSPMSITGRLSVTSTASTPTYKTHKRLSISECGSLPPLDLAGAFHNSRTLLPLGTDWPAHALLFIYHHPPLILLCLFIMCFKIMFSVTVHVHVCSCSITLFCQNLIMGNLGQRIKNKD